MFISSDPRLSFAYGLSLCVAVLLCSVCPAENLLYNADFAGRPTDQEFGWNIEPAQDQQSELTVVEGRTPETWAVRFYNDQRGTSRISQQFAVRPWRWYVAEVWVKTDGMYPADVGLVLSGGRLKSTGRYEYDYFYAPKTGWRLIRVYDHSGDSEFVTLSLGGRGDWSGELFMSEPVVRKVSLAEAVGYHPKVQVHSPLVHAPPVDPSKGSPGFAFLRNRVRRAAKDFPNALRISVDTPAQPDPDARVSLWLPPGISFIKLRPHAGGKRPPIVTDLSGNDGPGGTHLEMSTGRGETSLLVASDLEPGERATGYVSYEWTGGFQPPRQVEFLGVNLPQVTAPKRLITAFDMYSQAYLDWEGFRPGQTGREAMVQNLKRMGFNRLQLWGGDPRPYAKLDIEASSSFGGGFYLDAESPADARAVKLDGTHSARMMCPSYRGPAFEDHHLIDSIRSAGTHTSSVNLDDEVYLMSGEGPVICFCDRCIGRWKQWIPRHNPDLAGISPKDVLQRAHKYPKHYHAWIKFRCELVAERFGILRQIFFDAVKKSGVKTTARPEFWAFTGEEQLVALSSMESLSKVLDYISPMIYTNGDGVRREIADYRPMSGGKVVFCISPGYNMSPPGDARSQVLEAVMGGSKGFLVWNYDIGPTTTGHMADMSEAIRMLTPVEEIILDGAITSGYSVDQESTHLLARELNGHTVLLVSDYSPGRTPAAVTVPGRMNLEVLDRFTEQVVARLNATQRAFNVTLSPNFQARLYHLRPACSR